MVKTSCMLTIANAMKTSIIFVSLFFLCSFKTYSQLSFTVPDTVCVNEPVTITNTSIGATNYYWIFCVADISYRTACFSFNYCY